MSTYPSAGVQSPPNPPLLLPLALARRLTAACQPPSKSDDHSGVEPLLPISNRTVKRARADDSRVRPGESRSSSDSSTKQPRCESAGAVCLLMVTLMPPTLKPALWELES